MLRFPLALVGAALLAGCSPSPEDTVPEAVQLRQGELEHPGGVIYRWQQRLNEDGEIPHNAVIKSKIQRDSVIRRANVEDAPPLLDNWTWRGPGNIGGRIRGILIHPTDHDKMWIGSASGGVWMTTNGGASWSPLDDFLPSLTIGCMAMDPVDPTRLYVGTGEGFFNTPPGTTNTAAIQGAGILVSADSGTHWTQLPSTATPDFYFVNRIAIDPNNSAILLAATGTGIWRSEDAGATWSLRAAGRTMDLDFHPTDSTKAVAGLASGLARFSNDGGQTWQVTNTSFGAGATRVETAYARSDPNIVYASVADSGDSRLRVWRSTNGGQSYIQQTLPGQSIFALSLYTNMLWVDPFNPDNLLVGGVGIFSSTDGGSSFSDRRSGTHSDHHIVVEHPDFDSVNVRTVFGGNDGGIYRRHEPFTGSSWSELNNNLGITQFYGGAINPTSGVIIGGTQDNGTLRFNGNTETWLRVIGGDGAFCAADPTDPMVFYGETQRLRIRRSRDGGVTFENISNGLPDAGGDDTNFIPYFMLDPNNPNRMLAAGKNLWRSNDVKTGNPPSWESIKLPIGCAGDSVSPGGQQDHFEGNSPCNISTIAVAEGNSDIIWVGHNNGNLYRATDGTAFAPSWRRMDLNSPSLPNRWISRIAIDPRDHDRVYVSFLGYSSDSLWRTVDGGLNWVEISGTGSSGIPDVPVSAFAVHPRMPGGLFAGTDVGVFVSTDDGNTWTTSNDGPGAAAIDELVWKDDVTLLVVTHGRGIYEVDTQVQLASHKFVSLGCGTVGIPTLVSGEPIIGSSQTYDVAGVRPNAVWGFAYGPPATPTDFGGGCTTPLDLQNTTLVFIGSTTSLGNATLPVPIPLDSSLIGAVLVTQVLVTSPGGPMLGVAELTNSLEQTLGF